MQKPATRSSLSFIFFTIAIDATGFGIIMPSLPDVIRRFMTDEAAISQTYGYFIAVYALMQFLSSPFLGSLSDRFGRRPILLISLAGGAVDYFIMALANSLPILFIGRLIAGISGASFTVASAYIADISTDENRSQNFGIMGAGFGIGFIAGPAIGGILGSYGPQYPFIAAGLFNLLNFLFGLFVLPESLPPERRGKVDLKALNPFRAFHALAAIPAIRTLVFVYACLQLAGQTHPSIWTLYTEHRYGWSAAEVGLSLAAVGLLSALSQGLLTGWLVKMWGENRVLVVGVFGEGVCFLLFGLADQGYYVYFILLLSSLFWSSQPALQSLVSREVEPQKQGELQGTLMSITALMAIINPLLVTTLFSLTSNRSGAVYLPGSPYFFAGAVLLVAGFLSVAALRSSLRVSDALK